ncbi:MAG: SET domain-containing protein-lysine N-methyltransferase [Patescibacteria group bacterium]|nr:SET domain-containing protein-lysine N-methyltransferase [Patescibacteria group bacterium]
MDDHIQALIKDLEENVYCRLRPSSVSGVGVFAIRDIPKGINPFKNFLSFHFSDLDPELVFNNDRIDPAVKELVNDMYGIGDGRLNLWQGGLNGIDISFFMNHSEKNPNMLSKESGEYFITAREIKKGEELFADYGVYAENQDEIS